VPVGIGFKLKLVLIGQRFGQQFVKIMFDGV